jgi:pyruvate dehydrogenase E1 component alpha subunit
VSVTSPAQNPAPGVDAYFQGDDQAKARGLFQLVREDGSAVDDTALGWLDKALALRLLHAMVRIRVIDARMMALQRQGRIGFYGEVTGQEAAVVGSAAASEPQDWIVPALREAGVGLFRGMTLDSYIAQIFGNAEDPSKGRQLPCHPCDRANHYVVMSSCVSTQIPHAVGIAMAMKIAGDRGKACFGYMGDGGTSEGDFHVALNFAGVSKAPCVLICQNNQWAISTPGHVQTAAESIALTGIGYGLEGLRADGNDVLAVYRTVKYAADKARRGDGPTFIELLTYRVSAHSSSDDPSRYRDEAVTEVWKNDRDPIRRFDAFLRRRGWLAAGEREAIAQGYEAEVRDAIARQEAVGAPALETLIDDVYEEPTWNLREQLADLAASPRTRSPHQHG